jgi:hypothetical protein
MKKTVNKVYHMQFKLAREISGLIGNRREIQKMWTHSATTTATPKEPINDAEKGLPEIRGFDIIPEVKIQNANL